MPSDRSGRLRLVAGLLAAAALVVFVVVSLQVHRARTDPEGSEAGWIIGPPAAALEREGAKRIEQGLRYLNDTSRPATERIRRYRDELRRAEDLLVRSLRAQPGQARALATLAAVRWELDPPTTAAGLRRHLELIELASTMAPGEARVQQDLGELLLKMGRRDEGLVHLARAAELRPRSSREIIDLLGRYLFSADEMVRTLPGTPEVLFDLEGAFRAEDKISDYVELLDAAIEERAHPRLLIRFGAACLELGRPERLLQRMTSLGELTDLAAETERLRQQAGAHMALGDVTRALGSAEQARRLEPQNPQWGEFLGDLALRAGRHETAVEAFKDALLLAARAGAPAAHRARLYRKVGQVEEARGRPDLAYDAYRKSVGLDPGETHARRRVEAMETAAGFD